MKLPEQIELISFFECEPSMFDNNDQVPFFYNQSVYKTHSATEEFIFTLSPSYGEITIDVCDRNSNELLANLEFNNVKSLEILSDRKNEARLMITSTKLVVKIDFKPRFRVFLKEFLEK